MSISNIKESQVSSLSPTKNNCNGNKLSSHLCKLPYPGKETNILKLIESIIQQFATAAFHTELLFPPMDTQSAQIHLKCGATPHATCVLKMK